MTVELEKPKEEQKEIQIKHSNKLIIMGFAPDSREHVRAYYGKGYDIWGLNELYAEMPDLTANATLWFQLHGDEPPQVRDTAQVDSLAKLPCPVFMWYQHPNIPNSIIYPLGDILRMFDVFGEGMAPDRKRPRSRVYFTNSVSWMIALGIYLNYEEILLFGCNMAQIQEFEHQRPSCEFFLGWLRGRGIKLFLPQESDLLKCPYLYGYEDGSDLNQKLFAREKELNQRIQELNNRRVQHTNEAHQAELEMQAMRGALENTRYMYSLGPVGINDEKI